MFAPVILFVYNRPLHTTQTLEALKNNVGASEITLYIYLDGLKQNATEIQIQNHAKVRELIYAQDWCKVVIIKEAETNLGLANSIIQGVTSVVNRHGRVIVLEDDIVTSNTFLQFMNISLDKYESELSIACISGYIYPIDNLKDESFLIKGADCWGWGTWDRAWRKLNTDAEELLKNIIKENRTHDFDFYGSYPYLDMLKQQMRKEIDSWAICWYASAYLENMYTLYPAKSLVLNIGIDGTGTHSGTSNLLGKEAFDFLPTTYPGEIKENQEAKLHIADFFKSTKQLPTNISVFQAFINNIKSWLTRN